MNIFELLFYSTEIWGYFGVIGLVTFSLIFSSKVKYSFVFWTIGLMYMMVDYFGMITVSGYFVVHIIILMVGAFISAMVGVNNLKGR